MKTANEKLNMTARDFHKAIDELIEKVAGCESYDLTENDCEKCCEACPFRNVCGKLEIYYGCSVWEAMVGEDC